MRKLNQTVKVAQGMGLRFRDVSSLVRSVVIDGMMS